MVHLPRHRWTDEARKRQGTDVRARAYAEIRVSGRLSPLLAGGVPLQAGSVRISGDGSAESLIDVPRDGGQRVAFPFGSFVGCKVVHEFSLHG